MKVVVLPLLLSVMMLMVPLASASNGLPTTTNQVAPSPATTLNNTAPFYSGINLTYLQKDPVMFSENVTLNSSMIAFGPKCAPIAQEGYRGQWANLSIYGPADQITFNIGGACYATLNLSDFIWNYANASYAYHYGQPSYHVSLGSGLSAQGLTLAYQNYVGQFRFYSHYAKCNSVACNYYHYLNIRGLNVTPVMDYQTEFGNASVVSNGYWHISTGGNGSYNYSGAYYSVPFSGGASYANDMWRFTNATSSCIESNVQTTCYLWFGQSQELFYGEGATIHPPPPSGGVGTPVACKLTEGQWDVLLVIVPSIVVVLLIETFGVTGKRRRKR